MAQSIARRLLDDGLNHERHARAGEALKSYASSAAAARPHETDVRAEALRRAGNLERRRQEFDRARELLLESLQTAEAAGHASAVAAAWNAIALIHIDRGELDVAGARLQDALDVGSRDAGLVARVEQNYGVIANIRGDYPEARRRYLRSLRVARRANDNRLVATAHHNLGMVDADRHRWRRAATHFDRCLSYAQTSGDDTMRATVMLNQAEVELALKEFATAEHSAHAAHELFGTLGHAIGKSAAQRVLGMIARERGCDGQAEYWLRSAIMLASAVNATLEEAEARREFAILEMKLGHNADALQSMRMAYHLFSTTGATADSRGVASRIEGLEGDFLLLAAQWGRSLESADTYTFGHSLRVAQYATIVAETLRLDRGALMTIRVGAHLHDLGKVRVPREILCKPGRLTSGERAVIERHPIWGLEMLGTVEFPWCIRPIIRSHHEKFDGSGYPDRLRGDDVPLHAQIVCVADIFDAMTSARSYQGPLPVQAALRHMRECVHFWRSDVWLAFLESEQSLREIAEGDPHPRLATSASITSR